MSNLTEAQSKWQSAQLRRRHADDLLRTEAALLKRFDQLLLLHTQNDAASLGPKVGEFTSQQAMLIATMPTSQRVEDRVQVALALKVMRSFLSWVYFVRLTCTRVLFVED